MLEVIEKEKKRIKRRGGISRGEEKPEDLIIDFGHVHLSYFFVGISKAKIYSAHMRVEDRREEILLDTASWQRTTSDI